MDKYELLEVIDRAAEEGVTELDMRGNWLSELPAEISQLTNLTRLNLSGNELSELPAEIVQLTNLTELDLSSNQLSKLPPEIVQLTNLTELNLSINQLSELPSKIVLLTNLTKLDLYGNELSELPAEISQLSNLNEFYLGYNELSELPAEIGQLTNLTRLNLSGNELSELPAEISQLTNLTKLDLSRNEPSVLPAEIVQLTNLMELDLNTNQLSELPPEITQLTNLTKLDLSYNRLSELPPEITQLTNLAWLELNYNQLSELPPVITQLTNLTNLNLWGNQLRRLPPEIGQLTNLNELTLRDNQLSELPPEIGKLRKLTELGLSGNQLSELPAEIVQLTNLTVLGLEGIQLSELPAEIGQLTNLTSLYLSHNQLSELPSKIGQLTNLTLLGLLNNQLSELPAEIGQLTKLTVLGLSGNQLSELPAEIGQLTKLMELDLRENPLPIPPEILERSEEPETIINYYLEQLAATELRPLNEAKMLLVGQGGVGKTSLVKRLIEDDYNPHETKTEGINIRRWSVNANGTEIQLNMWDFGGQEIMHATHQFFLTKRSLYLLVLNAREDEHKNRIEYWLKLVQSFGGESPIIVVVNKCDDELMPDIDQRGLMAKYPNIKDFVNTSAKTRQGLQELGGLIADEVGQLEHIHDELPASWFAVKEKLENIEADYISYTEYEGLCQSQEVTDERSQQTLIGFLHDLGVVLNFREDLRLQDTNILNPEWVTNGVYRILNYYPLFQERGILNRSMLAQILDSPEYPKEKHLFIMDIMRNFELCFDFEGKRDEQYLVPDLLPKGEPYTGKWSPKGCLGFQYHYNVLPGSVMSRFIVRTHRMVHKHTYWRYGVVLARGRNKALVKVDQEEKKVFIWINGPVRTRREFLAVIRDQFDYIHSTISMLHPAEKVPIPDYPGIVVDYKHLLKLEDKGYPSYLFEGMDEEVNIKQLLDGVVSEEERRVKREDKRTGVTIHHVDKLVVPQAEKGDVFMDEYIDKKNVMKFGNNANISGQVVIANTIQNSFNTLAEAEVEDDVKALLEELLQAINQVNKEASKELEETAEEMARDAETLVKEATSSSPRRKWYEVSIDTDG
jgi:small GTP-binding protein